MKQPLHVIYVPGIRDDRDRIQGLLVKTWRLYGVHGHLHEMPWLGQEAYKLKSQHLLDLIDELVSRGNTVALVGASAGASAVINAYIQRRQKLIAVVYICGKVNVPEAVSNKTYNENPAFKTSMLALQKSLGKLTPADKSSMLSFYSPGDNTVPHAATTIPGVDEKRLPPFGHATAIIYSMSFGAHGMIKYLKRLAD